MRMVQLAYARHPGSGSRILSHQRPLRRSLSHDSLPLSGCFRRGPGARSLARVRSGDSDDAQARRKYGGRRRTCPHCGGGMWTLSRPSATRRERGTAAYARPACFGTLPRLPAIAPRPRAVQGGRPISATSRLDTDCGHIATTYQRAIVTCILGRRTPAVTSTVTMRAAQSPTRLASICANGQPSAGLPRRASRSLQTGLSIDNVVSGSRLCGSACLEVT
ncbi:hypothetical protein BD309DRAFT_115107 [Dichomitus squalens]|nr:hypothetical protein BD309DRAFT_115107 [Dichomitus squalens]